MFTVGDAGLPTSGTPGVFALSQTPVVNPPSPYGFVLFDLFAPSGVDTMYIADDGINPDGQFDNGGAGSVNTGGAGLSKWTFSPSTGWARVWNVTNGVADAGQPMGFRGLAGFATGTTVTLMATTGNNNGLPDSLAVVIVDNGTSNPPAVNVVATTPASQVFRGVALTPQ